MQRNDEVLGNSGQRGARRAMEAEKSWIAVKNLTPKLTAAEKKVLDLVSLARTNKEIALILGISPSTVKRHLENLLRKLQLRNRVEAAIYAVTVAGCPHQSNSGCPLKLWQKKRDATAAMWAV